jgi:hypothetical protein
MLLEKRNIRLVCASYPMRGVQPLINMFAGAAEDIVFVDNEKIFWDAVNKYGLKSYFQDMAGGNFGHCTPRGYQLLSENIARVVLREVFHH